MVPAQFSAFQTHWPAGQSLSVGPTELPDWQRLVERQKPQPERGVQVPQVVAAAQASAGGGAGVPEQSDGSHDQSA